MENELELIFEEESNVYLPQVVANENIRKANENERIANETERKANEEIRKTNEANREKKFNSLVDDYQKISYVKEYKKTYITETENESVFSLPEQYTETSIVDVHVNGNKLNTFEYTIDNKTAKVILTNTLDVAGTVVEITVSKSTTSLEEDFDKLRGDTGSSAYEVALENGFEGTEQEWLDSLKGYDVISDGMVEGESITITDAGNLPIESVMFKGKTHQETREGYNICPTDVSNWEIGYYSTVNGTKTTETSNNHTQMARVKDLLKVSPNTSIYFNTFDTSYLFYVRSYDINKNFIENLGVAKNGDYIATGGTCEYIGIGLYKPSNPATNEGQIIINKITNGEMKLLVGEISMPSIEYPSPILSVTGENEVIFTNSDSTKQQNYSISLGENEIFEDGYLNIEYEQNAGYKRVARASIVNNFKKVVLNGSESSWIVNTANNFTNEYMVSKSELGIINESNSIIFSDYFSNDTKMENYIRVGGSYICLDFDNAIGGISNFKKWLSEHPTTIICKNNTPEITEITDATLLSQLEALINAETYRDVTYINTINEGLKPVIKLGYNFVKGLVSDKEIRRNNKGSVYSTEEKVIGEWIDGRPMYRKVLNVGTLPNAENKSIEHGIENIDICFMKGMTKRVTDNTIFPLPFTQAGADKSFTGLISLQMRDTQILVGTGDDKTTFTETYVVLEYTKTTDIV